MDIECAFSDDLTVMKYAEQVIQYIVKKVIENLRKFGHCEIHRMSFSPIKQKPGVIHQR